MEEQSNTSFIIDLIFTGFVIGFTYYLAVTFGPIEAMLFVIIFELREIMMSMRQIGRHIGGIDKSILSYMINNYKIGGNKYEKSEEN